MTTTAVGRPGRAILRTETRLMLREPGTIFWIVAFPSLLLLVLGAIPTFRDADPALGGQRVIDLYVPIVMLLSAIMASLQSMPTVLSGYRETQVLRRYAVTPAKPRHLLSAQWAIHGGGIFVGSVLALAVGWLVYDVALPGSAGAYVAVLVLAAVANLATGGLISGLTPTAKASAAVGTIIFFPAMFTAGVWLPVSVMPGLLEDIVALTPNGAASLALEAAAVGDPPGLAHVLVLLVWTVALVFGATRWFRWE